MDIIAHKKDNIYAIYSKRYNSNVGNKAIQEVVAGNSYYNADISWVITNSSFTQAATD